MTGTELKQWREARGLTQKKLCEYLGMEWETYRQQETNRSPVNVLMELALCEVERRYKLKLGSAAVEHGAAPDALCARSSRSGRG